MSTQDNGGPAFPHKPEDSITVDGFKYVTPGEAPGMSLRDYFAAKVIGGLCANPGGPFQACVGSGWVLVNTTLDQLAGEAYGLADAMLKARQQ